MHTTIAVSQKTNPIGKIDYGMTNDYMFRAVLQENDQVLKGLVCSLLHLKEEEVISAEITNPIILGDSINSKSFILDIHVSLNNSRLIKNHERCTRETIETLTKENELLSSENTILSSENIALSNENAAQAKEIELLKEQLAQYMRKV